MYLQGRIERFVVTVCVATDTAFASHLGHSALWIRLQLRKPQLLALLNTSIEPASKL